MAFCFLVRYWTLATCWYAYLECKRVYNELHNPFSLQLEVNLPVLRNTRDQIIPLRSRVLNYITADQLTA